MKTYSDSEILKGIQDGDSKILHWIYQSYFRSIKKFIKENSGDDEEAEDVFQEAIIVVFDKIQKENFVLSSGFGTYFFSVARFIWYNELRRKKIKGPIKNNADEYIDLSGDIFDDYLKVERENLFRKHFESIGNACKKLLGYVFNGLSISEITALMKFSSDQHTKNRRLKCKTFLYNKIENDPKYKELKNEQYREGNQVPRW